MHGMLSRPRGHRPGGPRRPGADHVAGADRHRRPVRRAVARGQRHHSLKAENLREEGSGGLQTAAGLLLPGMLALIFSMIYVPLWGVRAEAADPLLRDVRDGAGRLAPVHPPDRAARDPLQAPLLRDAPAEPDPLGQAERGTPGRQSPGSRRARSRWRLRVRRRRRRDRGRCTRSPAWEENPNATRRSAPSAQAQAPGERARGER